MSGLKGSIYQGSCLYPVSASPLCGRCGESALVSMKEPHAARSSLDCHVAVRHRGRSSLHGQNPQWLTVMISLPVVSTNAHTDRAKTRIKPRIRPRRQNLCTRIPAYFDPQKSNTPYDINNNQSGITQRRHGLVG